MPIGDATTAEPTVTAAADLTWEAPGPGEWMLDTTHHGRRPVSGYFRPLSDEAFGHIGVMFAKYGLPLEGMSTIEVNDCTYIRPRAVGEGDTPKPPPPLWLMKVVARIHPELRRRNKAAIEAWETRLWRSEVDQWFDHDRDLVVAANRRFGAVGLTDLDDRALLDHLAVVTEHVRAEAVAGFESHGGDMVPVGDYLAHCEQWGIDAAEAAALLQGASPASVATVEALAPVARSLGGLDRLPSTVDELRAHGPEVAAAVDQWLDDYQWRIITTDDLDGTTLAECPQLVVPALLAGARTQLGEVPDPSPLRQRVPADERGLFDQLLTEARYGMRLRDDNVGVRWNWTTGLLRRALLEVGRRLVAAGRLGDAEHAVELTIEEVAPLMFDGRGPSPDEVAGRRIRRLAVEAAEPPATLGAPEPPPPFDALPPAMARAARAILALIGAMEGEHDAADSRLSDGGSAIGRGVGIGATTCEGTVRVVASADDALDRLQAGDVLVAAFTGPAYNALLPLVGGLVVEEGGPLCHAAIVSRELGIPAVIGLDGATSWLTDGDRVRLDPIEGTVTRLGERSGSPGAGAPHRRLM
jgi:pyruvate,water dikinase